MNLSPLLSTLANIAASAGELVMRSYCRPIQVEFKGPNDPVTSADRAANTLICEALADSFPEWPVVAEESDPECFANYRRAKCVFFVDPIDGTREFVDRIDEFAVMIGLVEGETAKAGVIHAPVGGVTWAGEVGRGAWRFVTGGSDTPISTSHTTRISEGTVLVSRSRRSPELDGHIQALRAGSLRSLGSAGLKAAMVADGTADVYLAIGAAGKRWDACAADALVTAAGGRVSDMLGRAFDYRSVSLVNSFGIVASNGTLHETILQALSGQLNRSPKTHHDA
jgi:3'(2'), 5'-bisphosphate nucleotidase